MSTIPSLAQLVNSPASNDFAPVRQERFQNLLQIKKLGLAVVQCDHVDAKYTLHWRLLVEIVEHDITDFALLQLDENTHAVLVGLIAQFADAINAFFADKICDLLYETSLVHLIRQLGDNDGFLAARINDFNFGPRTHVNAAPAS